MSGLLLQTKLFKPAPRPSLIARPQLIDRLNEGLGHGAAGFAARLTLVSAPAGFGKTTLVVAWLAQLIGPLFADTHAAWLSLDENDNDLARFLSYLIAALQTAAPHLGQTALRALQSAQPAPAETVLTLLLNDASHQAQRFVLVLDDYHVIGNSAVHQALTFLLEHLPPQLHLLLTTRSDPPLPLSRFRARDQIRELRADDLRFTDREAQAFFTDVMGLSLTEEEVAALETRTEGWVAGLQLAALSLRGQAEPAARITAFSGSHHFVIDYLTEEVLGQQSPEVRRFLLVTSVLDRVCGPLADALMQSQGGQQMLQTLELSNLFLTPLDEERRWYRYHHLFAGALRSRLQEAAVSTAELHIRASAWFEKEDLIDEAIAHALAAQDVGRAARLVEDHSRVLLQRSEVLHIRRWLEQLPAELVRSRPRLILAQGWVLAFTGYSREAKVWLSAPQAALALSGRETPDEVRGELALLQATIARFLREDETLFALARQALLDLPEAQRGLRAGALHIMGVAHFRHGDTAAASKAFAQAAALGEEAEGPYMALVALQDLASIQIRQGHLEQIKKTCQRAMGLAERWGGRLLPAAGMAYIDFGGALYEQDDLEEAERALTHGIGLLRGATEQSLLAEGYAILARIRQATGDAQGALATISEGEAWFKQAHVDDHEAGALLALGKARLWLAQGNLEAARTWARKAQWWPEDTYPGYLQAVTLARLRMVQSRNRGALDSAAGEAAQIVARLLATAEARAWWGQVIELSVVRALLCQLQDDTAEMLSSLQIALALGEAERYCRIFVDEGKPMADLLQGVRQRGLMTGYVDRLLSAFAAEAPMLEVEDALPDPLSEREMEVLQLAAIGASNKDIAGELFIALATVKKHMSNILVKLDAHNRVQAVSRAQELGLL